MSRKTDVKMSKKEECSRNGVGCALRAQNKPQIDIIPTLSKLEDRRSPRGRGKANGVNLRQKCRLTLLSHMSSR